MVRPQADERGEAASRRQRAAEEKRLHAPAVARQRQHDPERQRRFLEASALRIERLQHQAHAADGADRGGLGEVHAQIAVRAERAEQHRRQRQRREQPEAPEQHPGNGREAAQQHQILAGAVPVEAVPENGVQGLEQDAQKNMDIRGVDRLVAELAVEELRDQQIVVGLPRGGEGRQHHGEEQQIEREGQRGARPGPFFPGLLKLHAAPPFRMR